MNRSFEQVTESRPHSGETRQRLLTAAAELIAELGWGRVTTQAVVERAGLPLGAVSYHFRGKQELLSRAALATVEGLFPMDELAAAESVAELIGLMTALLGERDSSESVLAGVLVEALREAGRDPELAERMTAFLAEYRRLLSELVRAEQRRGAMRADAFRPLWRHWWPLPGTVCCCTRCWTPRLMPPVPSKPSAHCWTSKANQAAGREDRHAGSIGRHGVLAGHRRHT